MFCAFYTCINGSYESLEINPYQNNPRVTNLYKERNTNCMFDNFSINSAPQQKYLCSPLCCNFWKELLMPANLLSSVGDENSEWHRQPATYKIFTKKNNFIIVICNFCWFSKSPVLRGYQQHKSSPCSFDQLVTFMSGIQAKHCWWFHDRTSKIFYFLFKLNVSSTWSQGICPTWALHRS